MEPINKNAIFHCNSSYRVSINKKGSLGLKLKDFGYFDSLYITFNF